VRILLVIHFSNCSDDRSAGKEKVEGGLFGNSQIALKRKSCAYLVVDSHRDISDNRVTKKETVEVVLLGNSRIELRQESCA
jgi:hypothetical protein